MSSKFQAALDNFISSDEFTTALIDSTKAGFSGSHYSVELFEDGNIPGAVGQPDGRSMR
jgi:hypothetical protein